MDEYAKNFNNCTIVWARPQTCIILVSTESLNRSTMQQILRLSSKIQTLVYPNLKAITNSSIWWTVFLENTERALKVELVLLILKDDILILHFQ